MNSGLRFEFEAIQQDQARLHRLIEQLDERVGLLGRKLLPISEPAAQRPPPLPASPSKSPRERVPLLETAPGNAAATTPVLPLQERTALPPPAASTAKPLEAPSEQPKDSWELAFGTIWLARIGIVILLTGLVFLGNYAWQHIVTQLGPGGKLALFYLTGGVLAGAGLWLERRDETLRNYARVLIAGGAATAYYATYAAHYVERLRVIESPIVGGVLLLAVGGAFVVWAERRQSQTLALLSILLAYYTSAINPVGEFTLFSSLLLTAAAIFFLFRHHWATLGWASVAGTYGSYAFWRWHHAVDGTAYSSPGSSGYWWLGIAFLLSYWLLFTAASLLGKGRALAQARPGLFLTANNGAFFFLAGLQFASERPQSFWFFSLLFGAGLSGIAALTTWRRHQTPNLAGAYLAQGIALVTLGLVSKLTGYQLSLMLALESALLLTGAGTRLGGLYQLAAALAGAGAYGVAAVEIDSHSSLAWSLGGTVAAVLLGNSWWLKQRRAQLVTPVWSWRSAWFVALGLALLFQVLFEKVGTPQVPLAAVAVAVGLTAAGAFLRVPEMLLGQFFLAWATTATFEANTHEMPLAPMTTPLVAAALLAFEQWWKRQPWLPAPSDSRAGLQLAFAAAAASVFFSATQHHLGPDGWMWPASCVAIVSLIYGAFSGAWATALIGQLFALLAVRDLVTAIVAGNGHSTVALTPIASFALTSVLLKRLAPRFGAAWPKGIQVSQIARVYRLGAMALLAMWAVRFVDPEWLGGFFAVVGAVGVLASTLTRDRECAAAGIVFQAVALVLVSLHLHPSAGWQDLLAIISVPASLRLARRFSGKASPIPEEARSWLTGIATAAAWVWVTRWTVERHGNASLTVAWSALALLVFATGLGLRERVYRLGGFAILGLAIGRVFLVDVWGLETLYRILSFLVLGAVLLLLGYVYNRYAEKIRRWL